jgi:hypothetical protein
VHEVVQLRARAREVDGNRSEHFVQRGGELQGEGLSFILAVRDGALEYL